MRRPINPKTRPTIEGKKGAGKSKLALSFLHKSGKRFAPSEQVTSDAVAVSEDWYPNIFGEDVSHIEDSILQQWWEMKWPDASIGTLRAEKIHEFAKHHTDARVRMIGSKFGNTVIFPESGYSRAIGYPASERYTETSVMIALLKKIDAEGAKKTDVLSARDDVIAANKAEIEKLKELLIDAGEYIKSNSATKYYKRMASWALAGSFLLYFTTLIIGPLEFTNTHFISMMVFASILLFLADLSKKVQ